MEADELYTLAEQIGVNSDDFRNCLDNKQYADEVTKDQEDGSSAGVTGTPAFIVGILNDDGTVDGVRIDGAYGYDTFESIIESYL
jgi:predicted DsbA family dithiol-disulfide isomerase